MKPYPDSMDPIGIWLLKWIFIPLMLLFLLFFVFNAYAGSKKCSRLCKEQGYLDSKYVHPYRYSGGYCIMTGKRNADGSVDEKAFLKVEMK